MPKKPPKNSYFYFMLDFKNREADKGRNIGLPQAAQEASHEWAQMGPEERRPYELRAREIKNEARVKKYTTTGHEIDLILKQEQEKQDRVSSMQQAIELIVNGSSCPSKLDFYVGYVNHYCYCTALNKYLPAEISIVRFSLEAGVDLDDIFHVILDTGSLPIGYRLVALKQSEDTHGIPVPPHDDSDMREISESDMGKILQSMLDFLRKGLSSKEPLPPVYFEAANMPIAQDVLRNLVMDYGGPSTPEIKVYSLVELFHKLRISAKNDLFPITLAQAELDRDVYDFVQGISCKYHSVSDKYQYCSLSHTIRKIFIICDYTNPCYGIKLIAGKHVPKNSCAEKLLAYPDFEQQQQEEAAALPAKKNVWGVVETKSNSNVEDISQKPKEAPKKALRLPKTMSFAQTYSQPKLSNPQSANYINDFPALGGGDNRPRPAAIGRGRGRILQNK